MADRSQLLAAATGNRNTVPRGFPLVGESSSALITEVAARDRQTNLRDVSCDQLWLGRDANTAERGTASNTTRTQPGRRARCLSLMSPCATTTSTASSSYRNQTGDVAADPSRRYVVKTAGAGASSRERRRSSSIPRS